MPRDLRIRLIGTPSAFTEAAIEGLLAAGLPPAAVHLHGFGSARAPAGRIPVEEPRSLAETLAARGVAIQWGTGPPEAIAGDLLIVACYPRLVPDAVLAATRLGAFNIHPSLLPAYRGPAPLFWQLRAGEAHAGVTVHALTERLDGGPILARERWPLPAGERSTVSAMRAARRGIELLVADLDAIERGNAPLIAQDDSLATHQGWPGSDAFRIERSWSAERAYRFVAGTADWGRTYELDLDAGERLTIEAALGHDPIATIDTACERDGNVAQVAMSRGVLTVLTKP